MGDANKDKTPTEPKSPPASPATPTASTATQTSPKTSTEKKAEPAKSPTAPTTPTGSTKGPTAPPTPTESKTVSSPESGTTAQGTSKGSPSAKTSTAPSASSTPVRFNGSKAESSSSSSTTDDDADLFDTVLFHIGEFGRYQKLLVVAMIPFAVYFTWVYFAPMFLVITPQPFWCMVPALAELSKAERRDISAPGAMDGTWDGCLVYDTDWDAVLKAKKPPAEDTPLIPCSTGWEFDYGEIPFDTVVSERMWVCQNDKYIPAGNSAFFGGCLAGGVLFGWMADKFGRVPALMAVNILGGLAGMATIFTKAVWDYIILRFIHGMAYDNCIMIAYILVLEYVGPQYRTFVANFPIVVYYGAGSVALPWIAYYVASWRWFTFITSLPMFVVILAPWLIPESARWLMSRGRVEGALKVLKRFEKINKTQIPPAVLNSLVARAEKDKNKKKESFASMFKSRLLRQTAIFLTVAYSLTALVYDALVRSCESFGLNFFITFTINAAAEIPSVIMVTLLLDRLGRRNLMCGPVGIAAIFILIAMFVPIGLPRVIFAVAARFLINLAMTVGVQWTTELLPTPFRATGSATMHMTGFAASLLSPFVVYSERIWTVLPFAILVVLSVIASAFSLLVPETKGQEMPQTVAEAEKIILENSLYGQVRGRSISKAFKKISSNTFIEPVRRRSEGRVSMRLSGMTLNK